MCPFLCSACAVVTRMVVADHGMHLFTLQNISYWILADLQQLVEKELTMKCCRRGVVYASMSPCGFCSTVMWLMYHSSQSECNRARKKYLHRPHHTHSGHNMLVQLPSKPHLLLALSGGSITIRLLCVPVYMGWPTATGTRTGGRSHHNGRVTPLSWGISVLSHLTRLPFTHSWSRWQVTCTD